MRIVGVGDYVTWGSTARSFRVVSVDEEGVHVDGEYCGHGIFHVTWAADGTTCLRHVCGDVIDVLGSIAARQS